MGGGKSLLPFLLYSLILFVSCFFLFFGAGDGKRAFQHGIVFRPNRNERYLLDRTGFDGIVFGIFFLDGELSCEVVETIGRTSFRFHAMFTTLTVG